MKNRSQGSAAFSIGEGLAKAAGAAARRLCMAGCVFGLIAQAEPPDAPTPPVRFGAATFYSAGVADVIKLVDSKVAEPVVVSYVETASIAFQPTANEILALKQHGASDAVIQAMLRRGAEIRAHLPPDRSGSTTAYGEPLAAAPTQYAPAPDPYYDSAGYPAYPDSYPYSYASYGYPYYWWWPSFGYYWGGRYYYRPGWGRYYRYGQWSGGYRGPYRRAVSGYHAPAGAAHSRGGVHGAGGHAGHR